MEKLRIVVGGYIGLYPTGGATWDYIQYPLGLSMLGHDVYYVEDTAQFPVYQKDSKAWNDATDCVQYLKVVMDTFGFNNKWAYRDVASGNCYGMSESRVVDICRTADVFINISCSTYMRDDYLRIPKRILIDSDPMFTQIQHALRLESETISTNWSTRQIFENHNYLFTFGENIGKDSCHIPTFDYRWLCTRQPVCLNFWKHNDTKSGRSFTSVMNWSERAKIEYNTELWGQKDVEFAKIKELPKYLPHSSFDIVLNNPPNTGNGLIETELNALGWRIHNPEATVKNHTDYRAFIQQSMAEFSVAKETYVKSNSGWFSCRSACYLAAGKPVVTQETGWSSYIPSGTGLIAFDSTESAVEAIKTIEGNLKVHKKAATAIAHEYFDSNLVLQRMLEQVN